MLGKLDDHRAQVVEQRGVKAQRLAGARDLVDVRAIAQRRRVESPQLGEGGIEQFHPPVGAERRHAFLERLKRFALHMGEGVDLRGERVALRRIVVEICDAAFRIGAGDDAQRAAVGQMPDGFARLDRLVGAQLLRLPSAKVSLFRQLLLGAEPIKDFTVGRPLIEEGRLQRPDLPVGGVVQGQPLGFVEDRDRGRQPIDHPRIVILVALHIRPKRHDLGNIVGDAGGADRRARLDGLEGSTLAPDDRRHAAPPSARLPDRSRRFAAHRRIEEFAAPFDRRLVVGRIDGARVGGIAPGDPPLGVPRPCRHVRGFERAAEPVQSALGLSELIAQLSQLKTLARDVANAHDGAAGNRAAVDLEMAPAQADHGCDEGFAALQEPTVSPARL